MAFGKSNKEPIEAVAFRVKQHCEGFCHTVYRDFLERIARDLNDRGEEVWKALKPEDAAECQAVIALAKQLHEKVA